MIRWGKNLDAEEPKQGQNLNFLNDIILALHDQLSTLYYESSNTLAQKPQLF